jgi:nicotinamide-nucleotide amidase
VAGEVTTVRAAVLSIGAELLRGDILDTNAPFLAQELSKLGFDVRRMAQAGDVLDDLTDEFRAALAIADVVVCTGGLGPTQDDLTRHAIAAALEEPISVDEDVVDVIKARFGSMRRDMPERNRQQAEVIPSAAVIPNPNGTAPGWWVEKNGKIVATMPGPPREMEPMWRDSIRTRLEGLLPGTRAQRSLMTFGIGESTAEEMLDDLIAWRPEVTVATYAKESGVQVHITAESADARRAESLADEAERRARQVLGSAVFGVGDTTLSAALGSLLESGDLCAATMESVTGGQVASAITDTAGSSTYFRGGVVAYTREAKAAHGVDGAIMDSHGLISEETARAMAEAARTRFCTDVGISTTGIAGAESVENKPPGTCYVAVAYGDRTEVQSIHRRGSREMSKRYFAQCALDLARRVLSESAEMKDHVQGD